VQLVEDSLCSLGLTKWKVYRVATIWREDDGDSLGGRRVTARHDRMCHKNQYFHLSENVVYRAPRSILTFPIGCPTKFALSLRVVGW
jgi:hypothetical protein